MGVVSLKEYNTGVCIPERIQHSSKTHVNSFKLPNQAYTYKVLQALYKALYIFSSLSFPQIQNTKHNTKLDTTI